MAKYPWRFQGDIAFGETDPLVTVFMGEGYPEIDGIGVETGNTLIRQDTSNPVIMKLSELASAKHLADPVKMQVVADKQKQARIAEKAAAESAVEEERTTVTKE